MRVDRAGLGPGFSGSFDSFTLRITPSRPRPDLRPLLERAVEHLRVAVPAVGVAGASTVPPHSGVISIAW